MYAPVRGKSSYRLEEWARTWLSGENGWDARIYEVAQFDPIRYKEICASCTVLEVARAWKTQMALSEFAYSDRKAEQESINWL